MKTPEKYFSDQYGDGHIPLVMAEENHKSMFDLIKEYADYTARIQIEKDRERVIANCSLSLSSEYIIKELPITLD